MSDKNDLYRDKGTFFFKKKLEDWAQESTGVKFKKLVCTRFSGSNVTDADVIQELRDTQDRYHGHVS